MSEKMKAIHIVLNSFSFDYRVQKEVNSLKKAGYQIYVFALQEKDLLEEEPGNPHIRRFKLKTRPWPRKKFFQAFKYLECFYLMVKEASKIKPQIVHSHDLNALPIGAFISSIHKIPLIYDAHEFETEREKIKTKFAKIALKLLERSLIKKASRVITVSKPIALAYEKMYGVKPDLILNCPNYQKIKPCQNSREELNLPVNKKIFIYQGGLEPSRGLETLIETFEELKDKGVALLLIGYGRLEKKICEKAKQNPDLILFKKPVPPDQLYKYTSSSDFGLSLIEKQSLSKYYSLPNKLFQYLMAGLPVIVSNIPEQKRIVERFNCGLVVNSENKEEIKEAIIKLARSDSSFYRQQALKAARIYNWENEEKKLLKIYEEALKEKKKELKANG